MDKCVGHASRHIWHKRTRGTVLSPFRLFSSTPILLSRETRLGFERDWSRRRRRPLPKVIPNSTAHQYYPSSTKPGESSKARAPGASAQANRSFIFDLPTLKPRQEGFESFRDLRLRVFHEKIKTERTIEREMKDARWFSDPWYRMKKTPPRGCIVTRNRLPTAFLICFKPVHRVNEQDNPDQATTPRPHESEGHAENETQNEPIDAGAREASVDDTEAASNRLNDTDQLDRPVAGSGDSGRKPEADKPSTGSANTPNSPHRLSSRDIDPSATLVPHNVLHPKYSPFRGGRSVYATARRDVVEELLSKEGSHTSELLRLARNLRIPPVLPDMIQSQLEHRVVQELEMLLARIRATAADPQGKIRSAHQPSTKHVSLDLENLERLEDMPLTAKSAELDPSWMQTINGDKRLLHRLSVDEVARVTDGEEYEGGDVIALIDMSRLDATPSPISSNTPPPTAAVSQMGPALLAAGSSQRPTDNEGAARDAGQGVTMIPGLKGDIPIFHLRNLLPLALYAEVHTLLGAILGIETMIKTRLNVRKSALPQSTEETISRLSDEEVSDQPMSTGAAAESQDFGTGIPVTKSDLLALNSWAAPKDLTGRRGDLGVPLFIALYRLRLWYGEGWTQRLANKRGIEV